MRRLFLSALFVAACGSNTPREARPGEAPTASARIASTPSSTASIAPLASASVSAPAKPAGPFNVVLISVDSLRADMPWTGYARPIAPRLEALYKRSIAYTRGYSVSSFTARSIAGLLGGRYPSEMKRTGTFFTRYAPENKMFCETLEEQGHTCIAGHGHAYFQKNISGFDQGFAEWKLVPGITFDAETDPYVTSDKLTPLATSMLTKLTQSGAPAKPFFAWFHFMDPHDKYLPHAEAPRWEVKGNRDLYDQEVFFTDLWIGKLLDFIEAQPWAKNTVIAVTADHGEAFGEHGLLRHATELYDVLTHVPLFFVVPGLAPRVITTARSHVDLAPTFLDLLGAKADAALVGKSLKGELFGAAPEPRDVVCDLPKDELNARRRSLLHERWKILAFGDDTRFELYDLEADPDEKTDLFKKEPERAKEMVERYREASRRIPFVPPT